MLGARMPQYRVYTLDDAGKFVGAREIEAVDDDEAMELVRLYPDDVGFEVWSGSRMVGLVGRDKIVMMTATPGRMSIG
jgi:ATP phosphoribosyltransferase